MKKKIIRKQQNSKMCFLCGLKNPFGLQASFYELESSELVCILTPKAEHQSYPGRLHGGIITAMLDETIGRAILIGHEEEVWGVTAEFTTRFKKPVPLGAELRVVGRVTKETSRTFEGTGELLLPNDDIAATASGIYWRMPLSKIADFDPVTQEWKVTENQNDPKEIEIG
jgi:uncharacterized protein (TIGR00369 family)